MAQCSAIKANGERCKMCDSLKKSAGGTQLCIWHDPLRADLARARRSYGGNSAKRNRAELLRDLKDRTRSLEGTVQELVWQMAQILNGNMEGAKDGN